MDNYTVVRMSRNGQFGEVALTNGSDPEIIA